uniref:Uncharacterized protein n=1 Tax=Oryza brachyantha TaxID=4533 RepID=J3KWH4_ORYBR
MSQMHWSFITTTVDGSFGDFCISRILYENTSKNLISSIRSIGTTEFHVPFLFIPNSKPFFVGFVSDMCPFNQLNWNNQNLL